MPTSSRAETNSRSRRSTSSLPPPILFRVATLACWCPGSRRSSNFGSMHGKGSQTRRRSSSNGEPALLCGGIGYLSAGLFNRPADGYSSDEAKLFRSGDEKYGLKCSRDESTRWKVQGLCSSYGSFGDGTALLVQLVLADGAPCMRSTEDPLMRPDH